MKKLILAIFIFAGLIIAANGLFVVYEGEQAFVTRFGKPIGERLTAGLHFKTPFIEDVTRFESRILKWDGDPNQIPTKDKRYIWADSTARWRITDPLVFFKTVATVRGAKSRLDDIIDSVVRDAISSNYLDDIVRGPDYKAPEDGSGDSKFEEIKASGETSREHRNREDIINEILQKAKAQVLQYGIELIDVQIRRINYVEDVRKKVYERMISERSKVAAEFRSEGEGKKAEVIGEMQKELQRINSEAYRKAAEIRGKADAQAASVYAQAYSQDPEFYSFFRTLQGLEKIISKNNKFVLSTDSEMFKFINNPREK